MDVVIWNKVWRWEGPQRIRQFLWTVAHNKLLTNEERARRHIAGSDECEICSGQPETIEHLLRCCIIARHVWGKILNIGTNDQFFRMQFDDWWSKSLTNSNSALTFCVTCWILWKVQNERTFDGKSVSMDSIVERIKFWVNT
ncbi:Putative ribonuclease H protein At1g65750 [Linum perenne]